MNNPATALEVIGLSKRFGNLQALDQVSFKVRRGSFHALLGGNGAGKSTLVKCIMGYYHADSGSVLVDNHERSFATTADAHACGLGMVYQHFTLVPGMSVLENLVLSNHPIPHVVRWGDEEKKLNDLMSTTPFELPLREKVQNLSAGQKQKIEILKQLFLKRKILILDEPTSVLTPQEAEQILRLLKHLTQAGELTVCIITHKFPEVMNFAEHVTVLRHGKLVHSGPLEDRSPAQLADLMIGGEELAPAGAAAISASSEVRLEIEDLCVRNNSGNLAVKKISCHVREAEIFGIAGVSGNGQRELVEALSGQRSQESGEIRVRGHIYRATRAEMTQYGIHCLPEEPLKNACVPRMDLVENLSLRVFDRAEFTWARIFVNRRALLGRARDLIARYRVRPPRPEARIASLSGGNVQRLVLARELSSEVEVLVAANPCFGLDFQATAEIRGQLIKARNRGTAVLLVSEDLDELLELSDRIAVIFEGRLVYESAIEAAELDRIGLSMAGH